MSHELISISVLTLLCNEKKTNDTACRACSRAKEKNEKIKPFSFLFFPQSGRARISSVVSHSIENCQTSRSHCHRSHSSYFVFFLHISYICTYIQQEQPRDDNSW